MNRPIFNSLLNEIVQAIFSSPMKEYDDDQQAMDIIMLFCEGDALKTLQLISINLDHLIQTMTAPEAEEILVDYHNAVLYLTFHAQREAIFGMTDFSDN